MPSKTAKNWLFYFIWYYLLIAYFDWKIGVFQQTVVRVYYILKLERSALEIHKLWCRTDICSWKLSPKVSLMDGLSKIHFQFHFFVNWRRLFHPEELENHLQITNSLQRKPCFFKVIPGFLGHLVNFSITFLLGQPVLSDNLCSSCNYGIIFRLHVFLTFFWQ